MQAHGQHSLIRVCKAQEAALNKTVSKDANGTAESAGSLPTRQMLLWSQQLAQAAQSGSSSNSLHDGQAQDKHVSSTAGCQQISSQSRQLQQLEKPYQEGLSASTGSSDPFAFNVSASELTEPAKSEQKAEAWAAQPVQHAASPGDPFAFNMGAFGMGEDLAAAARSQREEWAADRAGGAAHPPQQTPAPLADPYAFNMGSFSVASTSEAPNDTHSSSQGVSATVQRSTEGASAVASASPADPFAFDMGAFGMSAATVHEADDSSLRLTSPQPQQAAPCARDEDEVSSTAQADPFAFDMGAFGVGGMAEPAQEASRDGAREGAATSLSSSEQRGSDAPSTPALIMPESFGGSPPMNTAAPQSASSSEQHQNAWRNAEQAGSVSASRPAVRQESRDSSEIAGAHSSVQIEQPRSLQHNKSTAGGCLSFTPPEQEDFEPLSEDEIRELESLLLKASGAVVGQNEEGKIAGLAYEDQCV